MRINGYFLIVCILFFTQCDKLPPIKKSRLRTLDTVVNFSSVDMSPSFMECDSIIDKARKSNCFRTQIHQKIGQELQQYSLESNLEIDEEIQVILHVTAEGKIVFKELLASEQIRENLPELDSILRLCIVKLPDVTPANKRGIPVRTAYQLPIKISLK